MANQARDCHLILLSHSTYQHLGALPYYYKSSGWLNSANLGSLNADLVPGSIAKYTQLQNSGLPVVDGVPQKVMATSPVVKMGAQSMNELCIILKENPLILNENPT